MTVQTMESCHTHRTAIALMGLLAACGTCAEVNKAIQTQSQLPATSTGDPFSCTEIPLHKTARHSVNASHTALLLVDMQRCFMPGGQVPVPGGEAAVPAANELRGRVQFGAVVLTQDWHPPGHVSFASTYEGAKPGDSRLLRYTAASGLCEQQGLPEHLARIAVPCGTQQGSGSSSQGEEPAGGAGEAAAQGRGPVELSQRLWPEHCLQGSELAALHPQLATSAGDLVIHKGWQQHIDAYSAFFDNGRLQHTELHQLLQDRGISRLVAVGVALDYCVKFTALDAADLEYETYLVLEAAAPVEEAGGRAAVHEMQSKGIKVVATVQEMIQLLEGMSFGGSS